MAKNLAKHFINLSNRGFSPNRSPELSLYHREGGFHVRPLMIVSQEGIPIEVVEVPHSLPQPVKIPVPLRLAMNTRLEWNIRRSVDCLHSVEVLLAGICLVSRYLVDIEGFGSGVYQWGKLGSVSRFSRADFNAGNNMGFNTAYQVSLNPSLLASLLAPLVVEPSVVGGGGEARRINGEVSLDISQWTGTLLNEGLEKRCQFSVLQVASVTGERCGLGNQFLCFRFPKVRHETPARHCGIGFIGESKHHIGQRQARSAESVFRLRYAIAEVSQQDNEVLLFVGLSLIIGMPFLIVSNLDRFGISDSAVWLYLTLNNVFYGVNMLALLMGSLKVPAGAERLSVVHVHDVSPVARLGWDLPTQFVFLDRIAVCYCQPSFLPYTHFSSPIRFLFYAYYTIQCIVLSIPLAIKSENIFVKEESYEKGQLEECD